MAVASPAPTAASEVASPPLPMRTICAVAPVAAPVVNPMTSGDPSAFLDTDWNTQPDAPSAAPTQMAVRSRGRRMPHTTRSALLGPPPTRAPTTSPTESLTVPIMRTAHPVTSSSSTATATTMAVDALRDSRMGPSANRMVLPVARPACGPVAASARSRSTASEACIVICPPLSPASRGG